MTERIKRLRFEVPTVLEIWNHHGWTEAARLYEEPGSSQARRIRRLLHDLEAAGLVKTALRQSWVRGPQHLEFCVIRKGE